MATVLASKGIKGGELTMWTIVTAIPQPLLAVTAYAFVQVFFSLFPFFAGFAAGCMIWISFAEIIPDALENVSPTTLATATTTSTFAFKALQHTFDAAMDKEERARLGLGLEGLRALVFVAAALACYHLCARRVWGSGRGAKARGEGARGKAEEV